MMHKKMPYVVSGTSRGGAPGYLVPEVALAKPGKNVTIDYSGNDAWALGVCMYEMMSTPLTPSLPSPTTVPWTLPTMANNGIHLHESFSPQLRALITLLLQPNINNRLTLKDAVTLLGRADHFCYDSHFIKQRIKYKSRGATYTDDDMEVQ
jgi:serine/threonine protein kinase